ncbi:hypothetical protein A5819_000542 [Enterococcus sp. 7E2_DIV0204]|nr:hypothetical protein A5819_000542 [Enterococcus sp. 7E2_DIV0204]OTP49231.1 hypothetical protein A5884_002425 [Enterococcus sp. 7D2_DIV0200]
MGAAYLEAAEHLRHTAYNKEKYKKRKETIERVFADAKEKHGMRWTKYRGVEKVQVHTMLVFAAMNLKELANWKWERMFLLIFLLKKQKRQSILLDKKAACLFCLQSETKTYFRSSSTFLYVTPYIN